MTKTFYPIFIKGHETLFWFFVAAMIIIIIATVVLVVKELKK